MPQAKSTDGEAEDDTFFVKGLKVGAKIVILEFFMSDGLIKSFSPLSKGQQMSMMVTQSLVLMTMSGRTEEPLLAGYDGFMSL